MRSNIVKCDMPKGLSPGHRIGSRGQNSKGRARARLSPFWHFEIRELEGRRSRET
jgi:hypothetical protein